MVQDPNESRRVSREEDDEGEERKTQKSMNPMVLAIGAVIVSLVACYFLFGIGDKASMKVVDAKLTETTATLNKVVADAIKPFANLQQVLTDANTKQINSAIANVPTTQQVTQAQNSANSAQTTADSAKSTSTQNQADLINVKTDITNLKNQNTTNLSDITTLKQQVADLTVKVNAIPTPTPTTTGTTTTDNLVVSVTDMYGLQILADQFNFTDSDGAIKLKITNNNTVDVTDLTLYLYLVADDNISPSWISSKTLSGGIACSSVTSDDYSEFKFRTSRITVAAGKTKTYYLTPSIQIKPMYTYRDFYTNVETNNTTTATVPATVPVSYQNNPVNITPTISKLNNDVSFTLTYDIIDYNLN